MPLLVRVLTGLLALALSASIATAQTPSDLGALDPIAWARKTGNLGPTTVKLGDFATLDLPEGIMFLPVRAKHPLVNPTEQIGNRKVLGAVLKASLDANAYVLLSVVESGHLMAADLAALDSEEILAAIRTTTRHNNAARMQAGHSAVDVGEWLQPPQIDAARNRFSTAIRLYESGPTTNSDDFAVVETLLFGRRHTIDVSLSAFLTGYKDHLGELQAVVERIAFVPGQRTEDFVRGQDKPASHLLDVIFGGRSYDELAAEAAEALADAQRLAAMPKPLDFRTLVNLVIGGALSLSALGLVVFALRRPGNRDQAAREEGIARAIRSAPRS